MGFFKCCQLRKIAVFSNSAILQCYSHATLTTLCTNLWVFSNVVNCGLRKIAAFLNSAILQCAIIALLHLQHFVAICGFFFNVFICGMWIIAAFPNSAILQCHSPATLTKYLYQFFFFQCCQPRIAENSCLFKFRFSTVL